MGKCRQSSKFAIEFDSSGPEGRILVEGAAAKILGPRFDLPLRADMGGSLSRAAWIVLTFSRWSVTALESDHGVACLPDGTTTRVCPAVFRDADVQMLDRNAGFRGGNGVDDDIWAGVTDRLEIIGDVCTEPVTVRI